MTIPPQISSCANCGGPLDDAEWCWTCAFRRQRWLAQCVAALMMFIGFSGCVFPAGAGPNPGEWVNWSFGIGTIFFLGGPVAFYVILSLFYKEHPKKK